MLFKCKEEKKQVDVQSEEIHPAFPGFEKIKLTARQKKQSVHFYNPNWNQCYFEITILLPKGEELFHSGLLAPGEEITEIQINYPLEPGNYPNSIIEYSCYELGSMFPFRGAGIVTELEVVE